MANRELLSVVISNYNHAEYIEGVLESIYAQNYSPMELIIIDDASTDNSVEVIEKYINKFDNSRLIRNEKNLGAIANGNRLMQLASGDYFYWIASDDRIVPHFFEKTINVLSQYPQAGLCLVETVFVNKIGQKIGEDRPHLGENPCYFSPDDFTEILQKKMINISGVNVIFKRSALNNIGGFLPELKSYVDFFTILVIGFRYGICYVPEPLAICRIHEGQYCSNLFKDKKAHEEIMYHMLKLLNSPPYKDVRPSFKKSLVLSYLFSPVIRIIATDPEYRYYLSAKLVLRTFWRTTKKRLNPYLPLTLKNFYYYIRNMHSKRIFRSSLKGKAG